MTDCLSGDGEHMLIGLPLQNASLLSIKFKTSPGANESGKLENSVKWKLCGRQKQWITHGVYTSYHISELMADKLALESSICSQALESPALL